MRNTGLFKYNSEFFYYEKERLEWEQTATLCDTVM